MDDKRVWIRISADILMLLSLLYLPWWAMLVLMLTMHIVFERYAEGIMIAVVADIVYGKSGIITINIMPFTIVAMALFAFLPLLKKRVSFYG